MSFLLPFIVLFKSRNVVPSVTVSIFVYSAFSIFAVIMSVPIAVGWNVTAFPSCAFVVSPLVEVTVRLTGFRRVLSYSNVFSSDELYIHSLNVMLVVSSIDVGFDFAVAFKNSQILQFSIFGLFL